MSKPHNPPITQNSPNLMQSKLLEFLKDHPNPLQIIFSYYTNQTEALQEHYLNLKDITIDYLVEYLNIFQSKLNSKLGELENYGSECSCHNSSYLHIIKYGDGELSPDAYLEKICLNCGGVLE